MLNIGWFSTGRDEAARQLLQAVQDNIHSGNIAGKINFVFSNREPGESQETDLFFDLVRSYNLPLICLSHRKFKSRLPRFARNDKMGGRNNIPLAEEDWRLKYDREVRKRLEKFAPDFCILTGYMLIIGEELCQEYNMINLHPAPPGGPAGSWQEVIWDLIENKAQKAGAMIHLVTPELDRGPVVAYCTFSIKGEPFHPYWQKDDKDMLFKLIRQHELAREFPLIISTLKALSRGEVGIKDGKVIDAQGKTINGYDHTDEINEAITRCHSEGEQQPKNPTQDKLREAGESLDPFLPPKITTRESYLICFDLEGPLAPQDNAYELMKLFPDGDKIFETISRYDDLLTLEGREDYEPGDTLALIAPFLAYHEIKERQITVMGEEAKLTPGAYELVSRLKSRGWQIFCISTSYEQYTLSITQRLGIPSQNVACTSFPLDQICQLLGEDDFSLLKQAEEEFITLTDDARIKQILDHFYWRELSKTSSGAIITTVKPVGGRRKVEALEHFATSVGKPLSHWVVVGDSITDFKMLQAVNKVGGLAVAFNANEYALPYSTMSLASTSLDDLWTTLEAWEKGHRWAVELTVKEKERVGGQGDRGWFHWLAEGKDITQPLEIHRRIRRLVREEAAKLG